MDTTLSDPLIGQVLDDRYRIDALIAVGGMATVYRALDTRLDRVLALKVMHPELASDGTFVERFIREAKSVARLSHPNVVGVYDQGTHGSYVYLAMEYVPGCTLRDVLRERGALRPRAALDILEPVLAALGAAHRAGFVHRDMKPENVLIGDDGRVKVADFGLVRAVNTVTSTTGAVLGTVSYLAPEQIEHGIADTRVDVYACGVVLYEMLTGARPHTGDTPAQVLYQHLNTPVPAPSALVPGLPEELDAVVASATGRNPEDRPADAVELLADARQARSRLSHAQLDAVPPAARDGGGAGREHHDNSGDRTSVIPRATGVAAGHGVHHTSRLEMPPQSAVPPPSGPRGRRSLRPGLRPSRGTLSVIVALVTILAVGTGIWYINSGQFTKVPPLLSKTEPQAKARLADAGLDLGHVTTAYSATVEQGTVISSDPAAGTRIRRNDAVDLVISKGPKTVHVPYVGGLKTAAARQKLTSVGLEPGKVTYAFSDSVVRGVVIRSDPGADTVRMSGSAVALVVSRGKATEVPDVTGESLEDARADLADEHLKVKVLTRRVTSVYDKGLVARQSPGADAEVAEGDTVTLTISRGPVMVVVPDVEGDSVDDAKRTLAKAGFRVKVDRGLLGGVFGGGDTVEDQSVDAGEKAPKGSTITIEVD